MKKAIQIFIALNLIGVGVNFVLQAGFGCDAITMLNDGIARFFQTNYTIAGLIYNTIFVVLALFFSKSLLGWGSISYAYGTGLFIDMYGSVLEPLQISEMSTLLQVLMLVIGQLMMCFAFAMLIKLDLGYSALDALLTKLEESLHVSYRVLKTICDVVFVALAFVLGATLGIGTLVCVLTGGFTINFFCNQLERIKH